MPRLQIGQAAQRVDDAAISLRIKRVHGEIAPRGVLGDIGGKSHGGVAAIGGDVAAKGCDLMRHALGDHRDSAMFDPGRNNPKPRGFRYIGDDFGQSIGGDINISHSPRHQRIAHAAANKQRAIARRRQRRAKRLRAGLADPIAADLHCAALSAKPRKIRAVAPQM